MRRTVTRFVAIAVLLAGSAAAQPKKQQDVDLQAAIRKETVDGDLNGAIKQYAAIVAKYAKSDRAVTAMAMVHMAECYQKMGNVESRKLYEQVLREYADQKEAVTMARARLGGGSQPGRPTSTLVWKGDKIDLGGTVSPDGRYISFVDWDTGNLALHEIATGQDRVLADAKNPKTGKWSAYAEESAISRDGKQIAYSWFVESNNRYELRLANLAGDPNPRRLYDDPNSGWLGPYDWSPDGKWIAVMISLKDRTDGIGLVSVSDGSLRILKNGGGSGNSRMFFSPDGKYLGYDMRQDDTSRDDVWVLATDGSGDVPAVVHRSHDFMVGWSPDGKRLLFGSDRTGSQALWSLPFADGKPQGAPEMIKHDLGLVDPLGVTRSGALYYGTTPGNVGSSIHVGSIDFASGKVQNSREVSQNYLESNANPWWSPDGKYLAYVSIRGPASLVSSRVLVIRSAETGQVVRELKPKASVTLDGWAPDGRSLLGDGRDSQGRRGVFRIDAQTGDISLLVEDLPNQPRLRAVVWSPDGKSLYFGRTFPDESAFFQRDLASGVEKELIRRPHLGGTNLSPDGRYMVTPSVDIATNSRILLLIPTAGGEPREVMRVAPEVEPADLRNFGKGHVVFAGFWAPDSRSVLALDRSADLSQELWKVPVDGGAPQKVGGLDKKVNGFRVHSGTGQIAYVLSDPPPRRSREVWVLENFLPGANGGK